MGAPRAPIVTRMPGPGLRPRGGLGSVVGHTRAVRTGPLDGGADRRALGLVTRSVPARSAQPRPGRMADRPDGRSDTTPPIVASCVMTDARRLKMRPPPADELFARSVGREGHRGKGRATDGTTRRAVRGRRRPGPQLRPHVAARHHSDRLRTGRDAERAGRLGDHRRGHERLVAVLLHGDADDETRAHHRADRPEPGVRLADLLYLRSLVHVIPGADRPCQRRRDATDGGRRWWTTMQSRHVRVATRTTTSRRLAVRSLTSYRGPRPTGRQRGDGMIASAAAAAARRDPVEQRQGGRPT